MGSKCQMVDHLMEESSDLSSAQVQQLSMVSASNGQGPAFRRERQPLHTPVRNRRHTGLDRALLLEGWQLPQGHRAIVEARCQQLAVRRECRANRGNPTMSQQPGLFLAFAKIPKVDVAILARRNQQLAVRG